MGLERGEEGERVRITNLNTASHRCVASSEMVLGPRRERERDVGGKGEGSLFGRGRRVRRVKGDGGRGGGGVQCGLRPRAVFSGGRLLQLQHHYKAGLLGFMNKARK